MTKTIWKYNIKGTDVVIDVPVGAKLLTVQLQYNEPVAWFLVNTQEKSITQVGFKVLFTGHFTELEGDYRFINTLQYHDGTLIVHVFSNAN